MNFLNFINQDKKANNKNTKGRIITICFRIANYSNSSNKLMKIVLKPYLAFYKIIIEWFLGIEIPFNTKIGNNLEIHHGQSLVINKNTTIGSNVILRHSTTIGNATSGGMCPNIGDYVSIGANCVIIGGINIGDHAIIGAGSVVVTDIPPYSVIVGNPARVIKTLQLDSN